MDESFVDRSTVARVHQTVVTLWRLVYLRQQASNTDEWNMRKTRERRDGIVHNVVLSVYEPLLLTFMPVLIVPKSVLTTTTTTTTTTTSTINATSTTTTGRK